jgi:succinate--hydroxymethylglutarate CoA-transferase
MATSGRPPLEGIRVLDFSRVIAGPACTQALADMGAEIIKIEDPDGGDDTRRGAGPRVGEQSSFFLAFNRGKKSVALDISTPDGQAVIHRLMAECDVLVENFRPGVMKRFGIDYESVRERCPRLVYLSVSAYGQKGTQSDRPGFDPVLQAESGMMSLNGQGDGPPLRHALAMVDTLTSIHATAAILAALYARRDTGRGQRIDLALFDVAVAALGNAGLYYLASGEQWERSGNTHPTATPVNAFATQNGLLYMACANNKLFGDTCRAMGHPEWIEDARFADPSLRAQHKADLYALMNAVFATDTKENWAKRMRHLPVGPVRMLHESLESAEVAERGMVHTMEDETIGRFRVLGSVYRFSDTPIAYGAPPPVLGRDTEAVLRSVAGCSDTELARLRTAKIIGAA